MTIITSIRVNPPVQSSGLPDRRLHPVARRYPSLRPPRSIPGVHAHAAERCERHRVVTTATRDVETRSAGSRVADRSTSRRGRVETHRNTVGAKEHPVRRVVTRIRSRGSAGLGRTESRGTRIGRHLDGRLRHPEIRLDSEAESSLDLQPHRYDSSQWRESRRPGSAGEPWLPLNRGGRFRPDPRSPAGRRTRCDCCRFESPGCARSGTCCRDRARNPAGGGARSYPEIEGIAAAANAAMIPSTTTNSIKVIPAS